MRIDYATLLDEAIVEAHRAVWRPPMALELPPEGVPGTEEDGPPAPLGDRPRLKPEESEARGFGELPPRWPPKWPPGEALPDETMPKNQHAHPSGWTDPTPTIDPPESPPFVPPKAGDLPSGEGSTVSVIHGRRWYLAPQHYWHDGYYDSGSNISGAFDPSDPSDPNKPIGSDLTGDGSAEHPFATLDRLLYTSGIDPKTQKPWSLGLERALIRPGDTIIMMDGIYDLQVVDEPASPKQPPKSAPWTIAVVEPSPQPANAPAGDPPQDVRLAKLLAASSRKTIAKEIVTKRKLRFARSIGPHPDHFGTPEQPITLRARHPGRAIIWGGDPTGSRKDRPRSPDHRSTVTDAEGIVLVSALAGLDSKGNLTKAEKAVGVPGYWHFEGLTFRDMGSAIIEVAGGTKVGQLRGIHGVKIRDCRFYQGANSSYETLRTVYRYPSIPSKKKIPGGFSGEGPGPNLCDPYGTPVTNGDGMFVTDSDAPEDLLAAEVLFKRWAIKAYRDKASTSGASPTYAAWRAAVKDEGGDVAIIGTVMDAAGNPYLLAPRRRWGYSTIRSGPTSTDWLMENCVFDRISGIADSWYRDLKQRHLPFAKLGYDVGPLPADGLPLKDEKTKRPNYFKGAGIFGRLVPLLAPDASGKAATKLLPVKSLPHRDWLKHWSGHTHGVYWQGFGHVIRGCRFANVGLGWPIKIAGHRRSLRRPLDLYTWPTARSHTIEACSFSSTASRGAGGREGHINFYRSTATLKGSNENLNFAPKNVTIHGCHFHGPPGGAAVLYSDYHMGTGLVVRNCTTTAPALLKSRGSPLRRRLQGGEWVLDPYSPHPTAVSKKEFARPSQAQAFDTPWQLVDTARLPSNGKPIVLKNAPLPIWGKPTKKPPATSKFTPILYLNNRTRQR